MNRSKMIIKSRNAGDPASGHDGNVIADDGKPKDIERLLRKHGGGCSLPESCTVGQQVLVLFNVKSQTQQERLSGKGW